MKIGDRVKLKANMYDTMSYDDQMAPGVQGVIRSIVGSNCYIVDLDHEVDGKRDWALLESELEVVE
jgi:hypothetical protein